MTKRVWMMADDIPVSNGRREYANFRHIIDVDNLDPAMVERAAKAIAKSRGEVFDEYVEDWMDDARDALVAALTVEGEGG